MERFCKFCGQTIIDPSQNFKTAVDLGITEKQKGALLTTLVMMETGRLFHVPRTEVRPSFDNGLNQYFNMAISYGIADCGTVGCIRGTAERVGDVEFGIFGLPSGLNNLFYSGVALSSDPTVEQAATALRSYLTTGKAHWKRALSPQEKE